MRQKYKVSPSTGITIKLNYHLSLFTGDKFFTRIDMDIMFTLLDHGYDDLEEFDSAKFGRTEHSQRISVVTKD